MEGNDLLKKVEQGVAELGVGEICHVGSAGPGDDADEQDTRDDGALETEEHKEHGEEAAAEDAYPEGWIAHFR